VPFVYLAFVALVTYLPGRLILMNLPDSTRRSLVDERTAAPVGWALSYLLISTLQLAATWIGQSPGVSNSVLYVGVVTVLWVRTRFRGGADIPSHPAAVSFALFVVYLLTLLLLVPSYETASSKDWLFYYPNTFVLLGREPAARFVEGIKLEYLMKRTPEMSLFGSFFVSLMGQSYDRFQVACLLPNAWVFWVIHLFSIRWFGRRAAILSMSLLAVAPAMLRGCTTAEPKFIAAFFILLSAYYYLLVREKNEPGKDMPRAVLAGVLAVAAFMCHPSMLFYSVGIVADQAYLFWRGRRVQVRGFWAGICGATAVLVVPWYAWLVSTFGWQLPFRPTSTLAQPLRLSLGEYALTRSKMMITTLLAPAALSKKLWHAFVGLPPSGGNPTDPLRAWGNHILRFYDQTYLGGMTLAVGVTLLLIGWTARPRGPARPGRSAAYLWMTLGAISCFLVHLSNVDNQGHATNLTAPLFILVLCYAGHVLSWLPAWADKLVLSVAMTEVVLNRSLIYFITRDQNKLGLVYVYESTRSWLAGPGLLAPALLAAALLLAYSASIRRWSDPGFLDT
jgi:hypothetical protein